MSSVSQSGNSREQIDEGPDFYQVEQILNKKQTLTGTRYLIKWKDYPNPADFTWEPIQHLSQVMHLVDQFNKKKESLKKRIKKQDRERVIKPAKNKQSSVQLNSSVSSKVLQGYSVAGSEKESKKNVKIKKESYLPKIVQIKADKKAFEKKIKHSVQHIQKIKDEPNKYLVLTAPTVKADTNNISRVQDIEVQNNYWFNSDQYKLGSITKHLIEDSNIFYFCDVQTKEGDLYSIVKLSQNQIKQVCKDKQRKYILKLLYQVQKQMKASPQQSQSFEEHWR